MMGPTAGEIGQAGRRRDQERRQRELEQLSDPDRHPEVVRLRQSGAPNLARITADGLRRDQERREQNEQRFREQIEDNARAREASRAIQKREHESLLAFIAMVEGHFGCAAPAPLHARIKQLYGDLRRLLRHAPRRRTAEPRGPVRDASGRFVRGA
jgi:hypothetical protein